MLGLLKCVGMGVVVHWSVKGDSSLIRDCPKQWRQWLFKVV